MEQNKKTVLIVEDDDSIALALEFLLGREGLASQRLRDGFEALNRIRTDRPDLVLLDVMLPSVSGHEICRIIRSDDTLSHVRILLMTASGTSSRDIAAKVGADAFIAKPFEPSVFRSEVRRLLSVV